MLQYWFYSSQFRLIKWSLFVHSTMPNAPSIHQRLDLVLKLCQIFPIESNQELIEPTINHAYRICVIPGTISLTCTCRTPHHGVPCITRIRCLREVCGSIRKVNRSTSWCRRDITVYKWWHNVEISYNYVCLIWFFTSHQQSFSWTGTGLPGLNQY